MEIRRVRLQNFRQFYGDQSIDFSTDPEKNVTLIHAENGVGKTTVLNAILWAFFGITTGKFEQKERLVNFEAEKAGVRSTAVSVTFGHEDVEYVASRMYANPNSGLKSRFSVMRVGPTGSLSDPLPNPEAFVNSVVPAAMARYFFFDGEQAEAFSAEMNNKTISAAIRDILGSTLIETAIEDLAAVAKKFNHEIGDASGDAQLAALEARINELETKKDGHDSRIAGFEHSEAQFRTQLAEIDKKLAEAKEAAQLQQQREQKEASLKGIAQQLKDTRVDVLRWISTKAIATISGSLTSQSLDFLDQESVRGRIPSPYNETFVQGLLAAGKCICDRHLEAGTAEWRAVTELLSSAGNAEVHGRVVRAQGRIQTIKEMQDEAPAALGALQRKTVDLLGQQNTLERQIAEIGAKIADLPVTEIREREAARVKLQTELEKTKANRIREQRDAELCQGEIQTLNRQLSDLALKNVHTRGLVKRRELALEAASRLQAVLGTNEQSARKKIEEAVNGVLEVTTRRFYKFEIDPSFNIRLVLADGTPTPKSGGENQMMSLAFLAALVEYAKRRAAEDADGLFVPSTVAPLVLDSPFGQLDDKYRHATAGFVPSMAPQVVLLLSSSQGKEEVYGALEKRIGAEYVLIAKNAAPRGDKKQEEYMNVRGQNVAITLFGCDRTMTEVRRIYP
jgi:DNA sulfur modification protein DndD